MKSDTAQMAARRTAPFVGINPTKDAKIRFKDQTFDISSRIFAAFSARFADELRKTELTEFVIEEEVSSASVCEFIKACQFEEYDILKCNVIEMEYLVEKWSVEVVARDLENIISSSSNQKCIIIDRLRFKSARNDDTSDIEESIRMGFFEFVTEDKFSELPISMISRLIPETISDEHVDDFFKFVICCLDRHGGVGSIVLRGFDVSRFKVEDIRRLTSRKEFEWTYVNGQFGNSLSRLVDEFCRRDCVSRAESIHQNDEICQILNIIQVRLSVFEKSEASLVQEVSELKEVLSSSISTIVSSIGDLRSMISSHQQTSTSQLSGVVERVDESIHILQCDQNETTCKILDANRALESKIDRLWSECESSSRDRKSFEAGLEKALSELRESMPSQVALNSLKDDISRITAKLFPFSADRPLEGIITYLSEKHNGNVMERDIIGVTASSECGPSYPLKSIVDLTGNNKFGTKDPSVSKATDGEWVAYDFRNLRIWPSHYTLRSQYNGGPGGCHPKSWVVEVSTNGKDWEAADRRENDGQLNGQNQIVGFEMNRKFGPVRYIRLRLTGPNHHNYHTLWLSEWEIFGSLREL